MKRKGIGDAKDGKKGFLMGYKRELRKGNGRGFSETLIGNLTRSSEAIRRFFGETMGDERVRGRFASARRKFGTQVPFCKKGFYCDFGSF